VCTASPVARWALAHQVGGPSDDLPGLLSRALPAVGEDAAPPPFAAYQRAARVNWRNSWKPDATGVWVRGGHPLDQHDHHDRGHVNLIFGGRPILIEAGTPSYDDPLLGSHYQSGVGHNVLQVGSALPDKRPAPITVHRLDAAGGDVTVDPTACYPGIGRWLRRVTWTADGVTVADDVALDDGRRDTILFRWHLGTTEAAALAGEGKAFTLRWTGAEMALEASSPLVVSQEPLPDATLGSRSRDAQEGDARHTCIVVRSREPVAALRLTTRVTPRP
jgi:hypothetical protein